MIEVPDQLNASLTVYKGDDSVRRRVRWGDAETDNLPFSLSQGYSVLEAIVLQHLRRTVPVNVAQTLPEKLVIKLRPALAAPQSKFITLCGEPFTEEVGRIFQQIIIRQKLDPEDVKIPLFVYVAEAASLRSQTTATSARRATVNRVENAQREILQRLSDNPPPLPDNARIGALATNVWATSRARNPNPETVPEVPQSNTFRQAMRIDYHREQVPPTGNQQQEWAEVPFRQISGQPPTIALHLPTLRAKLGLPPYPLFARDIFNANDPPTAGSVSEDIEDVDHILESDEE